MGSIESVLLVPIAIAFWTAAIAIPVLLFRRVSDLRHRVIFLEGEVRRLIARTDGPIVRKTVPLNRPETD